MKILISLFLCWGASAGWLLASGPVRIISTLPDYASIALHVGADRVQAESIAKGYQDAHFVQAKPSFARLLSKANLFLSTGLDLELWAPALVDKSRNPKIRQGAVGYVSVSRGITMMDVPRNTSRSAGDIHIYGNPHIHTDPLRGIQIAENIAIGLKKVDPAGAAIYDKNLQTFRDEIYRRLFGTRLVDLVGGKQLAQLADSHQLEAFLDGNQFDGKPLRQSLGGWLAEASCLRGSEIIAYHKNWIYFTDRFGIKVAGYVEDKPGIPPSARHVVELIDTIQSRKIGVILTANYYDESAPRKIEAKTGAKAVIVPLSVHGTPEAKDYFDLFDIWIRELKAVMPGCLQNGSPTS